MNTTRDSILAEITALKMLLADTDYNSNKLIEGLVAAMADATAVNFISKFIAWLKNAIVEYGEVVRNRAAWRERINELEKLLDGLTDETPAESDAE